MERSPTDLAALDRDVRAAAARVDQMRAGAATADGRESARVIDPFEGLRHVAGQTTYRALVELEPPAADVPLRDALVRWVHELLQARVAKDLELDEAEAIHRTDERLTRRAAKEGAPGFVGVARTFDEASRAVLREGAPERAAIALDRAAELAPPVVAARRERRVRRFEASRRLGLAHPFALASVASVANLEAAARGLLDATDAVAQQVSKDAKRKTEGPWHAAHAIELALAKDAREGWPARLGSRWLDESFAALAPRTTSSSPSRAPMKLPEALGGASFLRAAAAWGAALRASYTPRSLPWALARDPYPTSDLRMGFALAIGVAEPAFQRRVLGLPARLADAASRALRGSLLFAVRTTAARFVLAASESEDASFFEELSARVFGVPLPKGLFGAWPEPNAKEPARFVATLGAHALVRRLVDRFDEDWFRNPKAGAHLAQIACAPAWDVEPPPEDAPRAIGRAFEEALG